MFEQFPSPIVFAHRGASADAPENTLAAFQLAAEQGADGIELDVKLSADGVPVVMHDPTVDRTTDGTGKVAALTLAELKRLDAGSKKDARYAGERVPTLDEVFEAVGRRVLVNVELTNYTTLFDRLVDTVVAQVKTHGMQDRVLFSSFWPGNLARARRLLTQTPVALLTFKGMSRGVVYTLLAGARHAAYHPYYSDVDAALVARSKRRGQRLHVWTVDDPAEMRRLWSLGVDGLITDVPRLAKQSLPVK